MKKLNNLISTSIFCFIFWILFTQPFAGGKVNTEELIGGAIVSIIIGYFAGNFFIQENAFWFFNPAKILALIVYILVYAVELFKANLDVAIRALSPKVKINPGIVKIETEVESDYGVAMLANSITLTPGTITMDVVEENGKTYMYIHWIDVATKEVKGASDKIKGAFEPWVRRIFR